MKAVLLLELAMFACGMNKLMLHTQYGTFGEDPVLGIPQAILMYCGLLWKIIDVVSGITVSRIPADLKARGIGQRRARFIHPIPAAHTHKWPLCATTSRSL